MANGIASFQEQLPPTIPLLRDQHTSKKQNPFQVLARHYGWALQRVFTASTFQHVIILEEDFHAMAPILDSGSSLLAVSAFRDSGFTERVLDSTCVVRSDFFPCIHNYQNGPWAIDRDDWIREPVQRKERHVLLRPEISRSTYHLEPNRARVVINLGTTVKDSVIDR